MRSYHVYVLRTYAWYDQDKIRSSRSENQGGKVARILDLSYNELS